MKEITDDTNRCKNILCLCIGRINIVKMSILSEAIYGFQKNMVLYRLYVGSKKAMQVNLLTKQKQAHKFREQTYNYQGEGMGEGIVSEFGIDMYILQYIKWVSNKDLLYSTENSIQCYVTI